MAKVMIDVGAHLGETLAVAMEPAWGFDRIYSFEPAPVCWPALHELADDRVEVLPFGLWSSDETLTLYDPGSIGASVHRSKPSHGASVEIQVRDAAVWFRENVRASDEVVMKLNCEGAECEVLDRLLDEGELSKVDELLVHFDVRKVPGEERREADTRERLDRAGVSYRPAEQLFFGRTTQEKTRNWLAWYHAAGPARLKYSVLRRAEFAVRARVYYLRVRTGLSRGG